MKIENHQKRTSEKVISQLNARNPASQNPNEINIIIEPDPSSPIKIIALFDSNYCFQRFSSATKNIKTHFFNFLQRHSFFSRFLMSGKCDEKCVKTLHITFLQFLHICELILKSSVGDT